MLGIVIDCEITGFGVDFNLLGIALAIIDMDTCELKDSMEIYLKPEYLRLSLDGMPRKYKEKAAKSISTCILEGKSKDRFKQQLSGWLTKYLINTKENPYIIGTGLKYELPILEKTLGDTFYNLFNGKHIDLWDVINYLNSIDKIDVNKANVYEKWNIEVKKEQTLMSDCLANLELYKKLKECINN